MKLSNAIRTASLASLVVAGIGALSTAALMPISAHAQDQDDSYSHSDRDRYRGDWDDQDRDNRFQFGTGHDGYSTYYDDSNDGDDYTPYQDCDYITDDCY